MPKNYNEDDYDDEYGECGTLKCSSTPTAMYHECTIDVPCEHVKQFEELVNILNSSGEGDYVRINLTTPGGSLTSIIPLLNAIKNTSAHVHCNMISDVASAGTFIALSCDSVSVNEYVTVLFHNVSYGMQGSGKRMHSFVDYTTRHSNNLIKDIYKHFFTDAEIDKILNDAEIHMDREEFVQRYDNRLKLFKQEIDKMLDNKTLEGEILIAPVGNKSK